MHSPSHFLPLCRFNSCACVSSFPQFDFSHELRAGGSCPGTKSIACSNRPSTKVRTRFANRQISSQPILASKYSVHSVIHSLPCVYAIATIAGRPISQHRYQSGYGLLHYRLFQRQQGRVHDPVASRRYDCLHTHTHTHTQSLPLIRHDCFTLIIIFCSHTHTHTHTHTHMIQKIKTMHFI